MLLNLGCGPHYASGWVNVDVWPGVRADLVADLRSLPLPDGCADAVYAGHVLEHIGLADVPAVLAEIRRVLKPGAPVCVVGPDVDRIDRRAAPDLWDAAAHGGDGHRRDAHMRHRWQCTEAALLQLVAAVFPDAAPVPIAELGRRWPVVSRVWWQCAIEGSST